MRLTTASSLPDYALSQMNECPWLHKVYLDIDIDMLLCLTKHTKMYVYCTPYVLIPKTVIQSFCFCAIHFPLECPKIVKVLFFINHFEITESFSSEQEQIQNSNVLTT